MIVRNSLAPRGIDMGPASAWVEDDQRVDGGTFVEPIGEDQPSVGDQISTPAQIKRRRQWREAQQRRRSQSTAQRVPLETRPAMVYEVDEDISLKRQNLRRLWREAQQRRRERLAASA